MWIFYSCLVFIFSNILYLSIRYVQKRQVPIAVYTLFQFSIPAITYFLANLLTKTNMILPLPQFLLIVVVAFFWSYLGNWFSQQGILLAPNPGYSLIIQKSYVALTAVLSVFIFGANLSGVKLLAIIVVLIGIFFLVQNQPTVKQAFSSTKNQSTSKWLIFSLGSHLCFAFGSLMSKHFLTIGLTPSIYLLYTNLVVITLNAQQFKTYHCTSNLLKNNWLILLIIGLSSAGFNLSAQFGYKVAPNIGYVAAFNTASIMGVIILSSLLFKDELSKKKLLAAGAVLAGLILLVV